jgi:hypothetical protein
MGERVETRMAFTDADDAAALLAVLLAGGPSGS